MQDKTLKSSTPDTLVMNATTSERDTTVGDVDKLLLVPSTTLNVTTLGPSQNTIVSMISKTYPHTTMTNETTAKEAVETTSSAVIPEMSLSTQEKHDYSVITTKTTGLEDATSPGLALNTTVTKVTTAGIVDEEAATILGITLNTSVSNAATPDRRQNTTMATATSPETTPGTTDTHTYSTETALKTRSIDATSSGMGLSTRVTNETTRNTSSETTVTYAVTPEIMPSSAETHATAPGTLNTTMSNATSPEIIFDMTNLTTAQIEAKTPSNADIPQTMVNTTVTHTTSPETTPSTTDARTYSSETILNSRLLDATSSGMDLSTRVTNKTTTDQSQNTIMSNATSQEKLNTLLTDVTTTQVAVNKTVVDVVTSEITLNATVTHATTQKITLKTTMSNATSPETILDTTVANVTPKQTAVETTSNAAILEKTTTIRAFSLGTTLSTTLVDATSPGMVNKTLKEFNGTLTINMDFENSYNDPSSNVYEDVCGAAESNCQKFVSKTCIVQSLFFRSGSTIAYYTLITPSGDVSQVKLAKDEMLKRLAETYPVEFAVEEVNNTTVFAGEEMTLTCGPPPEDLNFTVVKSVEWTHMGTVIEKGISLKNGQSVLTLSSFFPLHDGIYVCKLKRGDNSTFKQSINAKAIPIPQISVNPVKMSVECDTQHSVLLNCFVDNGYTVTFLNTDVRGASHVTHEYTVEDCSVKEKIFTCESQNSSKFSKYITLMFIPSKDIKCQNDTFGNGPIDFVAELGCEKGKVGEIRAVCQSDGKYGQIQDNCVLEVVKNLLDQSEVLDELTLPLFLEQLSNVTVNFTDEITNSPANIDAIVRILFNVANSASSLEIKIEKDSMENILETVGTLTIGEAKTSWETLNNNNTRNTNETKEGVKVNSVSSSLLYSIERITSRLVNKSFSIETPHICLNKLTLVNTCSVDLNSSVKIDIPNHSITTIIFAFMDNVLPPRDKSNSSSKVINGKVALLWPEDKITNISLAFDVLDDRLRNPECVFWDFNLFGGRGGWNDDGCSLVFNENGVTNCHCNHTTSFSILMSPNSSDQFIFTYITYIGLAISIVSLIICLITEGIIWKTIGDNMTLYFRHVSIVNIALSLLIADIWFIIGAAISNTKSAPACTAATFFIHSFYLALFFWMLASALLLLYRTFNVFDVGLSKKAMLIIGFSLGYGAPLIIATITIAVTAPSNHYIGEKNVFWLSWDTHKTSLAFVIPALTIVAINIIILTLVISKILRRRVGMIGTQARERHALLVVVRCTAVLTPIFGVTWVLGIGTMVSENVGLDVAFALLNSLQGFCILMFGTLSDKKVISELAKKFSCQSRTRTTSPASVFTLGKLFWKLRRSTVSQKGYHWSSEGSGD
ncbi:adhesion G protein-coupled receptor F5-like isoform X1 [Xiphophorus hellerii]|uniref:adhesion G protein-coupled receptor F5-like isoform X1 n=1 Tax=Xiphophorus hellerii TaxID=8084 RepID=UPI0013B3EA24|nr:adhesion G protein-coupled receptor F5-like isoform X1 [Xiphophorus hellerii]